MTKIGTQLHDTIDYLDFAGSRVAVIRESVVRAELPPEIALGEIRSELQSAKQRKNLPRIRVESVGPEHAWLHTLRARFDQTVGGKDYSSPGFNTPALWLTVVSMLCSPGIYPLLLHPYNRRRNAKQV